MANITKSWVDAARPSNRAQFFYDDTDTGFGLKITPTGRKVFILDYRAGRRTRRHTIGRYPDITVYNARKEARRLRGLVADGSDPSAIRRAAREALTFREGIAEFDREHIAIHCKASTAREYRRLLARDIPPEFANLAIRDVTRDDVGRLHRAMSDRPYFANRVRAVLSKFFSWAEAKNIRPDNSNPCRHVPKFKEAQRKRYLSVDEMKRLAGALDTEEEIGGSSPFGLAAIRLLLLTGARKNEILSLLWEHVDLDASCLRLPDSKTGAKIVRLSPPAKTILAALPRVDGNPHVIIGKRQGSHLEDIRRVWERVLERAGLEGVRRHDLRHSFASMAIAGGMSLPMVGELLGHKSVQTTARYAHLADDPVRAAAEQVGNSIAEAMGGSKT